MGFRLLVKDFSAAVSSPTPVLVPQARQVVNDVRMDDTGSTYAELITQGASALSKPQDRPAWRARTAHIADPDGHMIEIYTFFACVAGGKKERPD